MRRGQDPLMIILGGQEESNDTAYLSGCDSRVVGALLSSLSALPDALAPRVNSAVVTECLRIRLVFEARVSSFGLPARRAPA